MVVDLEVAHVTMDSVADLENDQDRGKNPFDPMWSSDDYFILDHRQDELDLHHGTMHIQADIKLPFHCSKSNLNHFCPIYESHTMTHILTPL